MEVTVLRSCEELRTFRESAPERISDNIACGTYATTRLLAVAEHAVATEIWIDYDGKAASVGVGDRNTDVLAMLAASAVGGAYIYPKIIRTKLDLARDPAMAASLSVRHRKGTINVPISNERKALTHVAETYHKAIEKLAPRAIVAYHGMHRSYNMDMLLGFGPSHEYIGGTKNAFLFRRAFRNALNEELKKRGMMPVIVKIARSRFTGSKNYTLARHVKGYNDLTHENRIGVHAEFNRRGRVATDELPSPEYQIAAQVLARCANEWREQ